jgi:hypothetical protein
MGMPTAPKTTGTVFMTRLAAAARTALKPMPTSMGAANAAGVPNPLRPSTTYENDHAMSSTRITGSGVEYSNRATMTSIAPESRNVRNSTSAPKMIESGMSEVSSPSMTRAGSAAPPTS